MPKKLCPICGEKLKTWYHSTEWGVMENGEKCLFCGFLDEFSYGRYRVVVGGKEWTWSYHASHEEVQKIECEIEAAIKIDPQAETFKDRFVWKFGDVFVVRKGEGHE